MKTYILISVCLSSLIWLAADNINDTDSISRVQISDENKTSSEDAFFVQSWYVVGVSLVEYQDIQNILDKYTGKKISFKEVKNAGLEIEKYYQDMGFLAKVNIPPQDVTNGVVQLEILEARLGKISIEKDGSSLVEDQKILSIVRGSLKEGEYYEANSLNRGLLLSDDLPGVSLTGFLQEGNKSGLVDLSLKTLKEESSTMELSIDNANARALGSERMVFSGSLISPLRQAEIISINSLISEGSFSEVYRFHFHLVGRV